MQLTIRKELSEPNCAGAIEAHSGARRSNRARKPNTLYKEALDQLKKTGRARPSAKQTVHSYFDKDGDTSTLGGSEQKPETRLHRDWLRSHHPTNAPTPKQQSHSPFSTTTYTTQNSSAASTRQIPPRSMDPTDDQLTEPKPRKIPRLDKPKREGLLQLLISAAEKVNRQGAEMLTEELEELGGSEMLGEMTKDEEPMRAGNCRYAWKLVMPLEEIVQGNQEGLLGIEEKYREIKKKFDRFRQSLFNAGN